MPYNEIIWLFWVDLWQCRVMNDDWWDNEINKLIVLVFTKVQLFSQKISPTQPSVSDA